MKKVPHCVHVLASIMKELQTLNSELKQIGDDITDKIVDIEKVIALMQIVFDSKYIDLDDKSGYNEKKQLEEEIKQMNLDTECFFDRCD